MRTMAAVVAAVAILSTSGLGAQETRAVRGTVTDSAGVGLDGAMVVALALPDTVLTRFDLTDGDGRFHIGGLPPGPYLLQVTMTGYKPVRSDLTIASEEVDAGSIAMEVQAYELAELVVSIEHVPFVNRRDTLDFNALAFTTPPNATVEELLARLPGIEVDDDGTIRAQGEEVRNVLVDGREFFGTDPTIATRNLPADAVQRVQVYDRESDMAEFTGIADGEEERTINLQLREEARSGYFGQVAGGVGGGLQPSAVIESQPTGRTRYDGDLGLFRFSPGTQLALLSGANNVNDASFGVGEILGGGGGGDRGGRGRGGRGSGFTETLVVGLNGSHDFSDDRWIRGSYFYTGVDNTQNEAVQQQQLLGSTLAALQSSTRDQVTDNASHRVNLNAQYEVAEGHDLRLRTNLSLGSSTTTSLSTDQTATLDGDIRNTGTSANRAESDDLTGSGQLTWRKRLSESGRAVVVEAQTSLREPERRSELETRTGTAAEDGELRFRDVLQEQTRSGRTRSWSGRVSLSQPLGEGSVLELFGERSAVDEDQDNTVVDLDTGTPVINDDLTSGFERTYAYLRGGLRFNRNSEERRLVLGLQVQSSDLEGTILDRDEEIATAYTHVLPSADLRLRLGDSKTLSFGYRTSTREPSLTELQPFADNTNPTRIYVGNPNLTPEYTHALSADYRFFDEFSFVNLFSYVRFSYTTDEIVQSRIIDEQAIQTLRPTNIDHSWSANGGLSYGRPIRRLGVELGLDYGASFSRGTELLNGTENESRVWNHTVSASVENRNKERFDLEGGVRLGLNDVAYTLNQELNQSYLDRTFFGRGLLRIADVWTLQSDFNYRLYDDDVFGAGDRNVAMWNASIGRLAMDNRVQLSLEAFDLLDQNKGVTYTNGSSYIQERRVESLGRYVMLTATYHLGNLGGRRGMPGMRGGRDRR